MILSSIEMDTTLQMDGKGCLDINMNYLFFKSIDVCLWNQYLVLYDTIRIT